jgi:hypothetical protein
VGHTFVARFKIAPGRRRDPVQRDQFLPVYRKT